MKQKVLRQFFKSNTKNIALGTAGVIFGGFLSKNQNNQMDSQKEGAVQSLYSWGYGNFGQLGLGNEQNKHTPQQIMSLKHSNTKIKQIASKKSVSAIVTSDGKVLTWGKNKNKVLGSETSSTNMSLPTIVSELMDENIKQVSCGPNHMLAVNENGEVFSWGSDDHGKLGHSFMTEKAQKGSKNHYHTQNFSNRGQTPQKVQGLPEGTKIVMGACGAEHSILLSDKGEVFTFGYDKKGSLGKYEIELKNQFATSDDVVPHKIQFFDGKKIVKVSAGLDFSIVQTEDGKLYGWGNNDYGQLGTGSNNWNSKPKQLYFGGEIIKSYSCGDYYAGAISDSGKLYAWGYGSDGQLCQKSKEDIYSPQVVQFNQKASQISCGSGHVAIISDSDQQKGELYVFGRGREGQLGLGDTYSSEATNRTEPKKVVFFQKNQKVIQVRAGGEHTLALVEEN